MSERLRNLSRAAGAGALLASAHFAGDLASAFRILGQRFYPSGWAWGLLVGLGLAQALLGALAGGLLGGAWALLRGRRSGGRPAEERARGGLGGLGLAGAALAVAAAAFVHGGSRRAGLAWTPPERPAQAARAGAPSVLWVVVDTLRADTLYGDDLSFPHAPEVGALAQRSVVFTDVESPAGWTLPSTATLLTGDHPVSLGAVRGALPRDARTIAERLAEAGYATAAVVDNALVDSVNGYAQGFQTWKKRSAMEVPTYLLAWKLLPAAVVDRLRHELPISYRGADVVTREALDALGDAGEGPLFLYVHYMDVHTPYRSHADLRPVPTGVEEVPLLDRTLRGEMRHDEARVSDGQKRMIAYLYENELTFVDRGIGELVRAFEARYGDDDTLIVVTSDHGEEMYEHGSFGHGWTLYRELVQVPLVLRLPASAAPPARRSQALAAPVGLVDLVPTTLDALELAPDDALEGRSLLPWIRGEVEAPDRPLFSVQQRFGRALSRWRTGGWAYVTTRDARGRSQQELFDKVHDYPEAQDLHGSRPELALRLAAELEAFVAAQLERAGDAGVGEGASEEALRALGYAGN